MTTQKAWDITIPDDAGEGPRRTMTYRAYYETDAGSEWSASYCFGTVSFPAALERDNPYRQGATLSDDAGRIAGWVEKFLPRPDPAWGPGQWRISLRKG